MKLHSLFLIFMVMIITETAFSHIRMVKPLARTTSDGTKQGPQNPDPCGGTVVNPSIPTLELVGGSQLEIELNETIRHAGRFKVQWSITGQDNFASQVLATKQNTPSAGGLHKMTVTIPNIDCPSCIIRVIQEMDDQPTQTYVQCIDSKFTKSTVAPSPTPSDDDDASKQSASKSLPEMSSCGLVASQMGSGNGPGPRGVGNLSLIFLLLPMILALLLRQRSRAIV